MTRTREERLAYQNRYNKKERYRQSREVKWWRDASRKKAVIKMVNDVTSNTNNLLDTEDDV